jgi:hypothetical protein
VHPPADEVRQIQEHAINEGMEGEQEAIRQIGVRGDAGLQVRAIVLLLSLPCLQALHFTHDHEVRHFDTLFLKLVLAQQQQKLQFLPDLTSFERKCSENNMIGDFSGRPVLAVGHLVPVMLVPSIQTASVTYALMPKVAMKSLDLRDILTNKSFGRMSSIQTLNLHRCRLSNADLQLILQFPRNLRSLSISLWGLNAGHPQPHLKSVLVTISEIVSHSLEQLHICSVHGWIVDDSSLSGIFQNFAQLRQLSLPIEVLLEPSSSTLENLEMRLPPSVIHLAIFSNRFSESERDSFVEFIDEIITAKGQSKINVQNIASERRYWRCLGKEQLNTLNERAQIVGVSFSLASSGDPSWHAVLDIERLHEQDF